MLKGMKTRRMTSLKNMMRRMNMRMKIQVERRTKNLMVSKLTATIMRRIFGLQMEASQSLKI